MKGQLTIEDIVTAGTCPICLSSPGEVCKKIDGFISLIPVDKTNLKVHIERIERVRKEINDTCEL